MHAQVLGEGGIHIGWVTHPWHECLQSLSYHLSDSLGLFIDQLTTQRNKEERGMVVKKALRETKETVKHLFHRRISYLREFLEYWRQLLNNWFSSTLVLIAVGCKGLFNNCTSFVVEVLSLPQIDHKKVQVSVEFLTQGVVQHELKNALQYKMKSHD